LKKAIVGLNLRYSPMLHALIKPQAQKKPQRLHSTWDPHFWTSKGKKRVHSSRREAHPDFNAIRLVRLAS
jgi:hypothetical protein